MTILWDQDLKGQYFITWMLLKQNLAFKIFHVYTHTNKFDILPKSESLLSARSFNISLCKIQYFSSNFLMRKFSVNGQFPQVFHSPKIYRNCRFTENFLTRKLGEKYCILHSVPRIYRWFWFLKDNDILSVYHYICFNSFNVWARNCWENSRKNSRSIRCC